LELTKYIPIEKSAKNIFSNLNFKIAIKLGGKSCYWLAATSSNNRFRRQHQLLARTYLPEHSNQPKPLHHSEWQGNREIGFGWRTYKWLKSQNEKTLYLLKIKNKNE
jgi:hypothetical protein